MVGGTLQDIREHVETLSVEDGPYAVVCGRTGREPVPAAGVRFDDRESAAEAAEAASEYRSVLRRYDPQVQYLEPLVHEVSDGPVGPLASEPEDVRVRYLSFCHDVAGAVFEALSTTGHREVESATMETYLTLAEVVSDRDDFCLTMLWSMMSELDVRLGPRRQATVVRAAAENLSAAHGPRSGDAPEAVESPAVESAANSPVEATMRRLSSSSFVGDYRVVACPDDDAWEVSFGDYALAERTGRLPTLPLAVDLVRRVPDRTVRFTDATALSDCRWRVRVEMDRGPEGLTSLTASDDGSLNDPDYRL
ncbi:DUF7551 domain-containing protein [Halopelagius longus]|uniref:Uncharacterized protein n=1 Tax=Halopelagius longus TaxID=1236180 RepID=A0A1H1BYB7_9EURY|nr:hypothetical protein [Halopelagius longus]RDI70981.1 hypothetical protein DWB78_04145 [Halopelagius longus]SDQ56957.1 hypothetical protein SAMN05216278_2020 [Halopelagius longus]